MLSRSKHETTLRLPNDFKQSEIGLDQHWYMDDGTQMTTTHGLASKKMLRYEIWVRKTTKMLQLFVSLLIYRMQWSETQWSIIWCETSTA